MALILYPEAPAGVCTNRNLEELSLGPAWRYRPVVMPAWRVPLGTIRSLAYFLPLIGEALGLRVSRITSNISATSWDGSCQYGRAAEFCATTPDARLWRG